MSVEMLNRRPIDDDTNPLAVLVTHAMHSTRSWLSLATGAPLPDRDRDAEFLVVVDDGDAFRSWLDAMSDECRALLDGDVGVRSCRPGERRGGRTGRTSRSRRPGRCSTPSSISGSTWGTPSSRGSCSRRASDTLAA